MHFLIGILKLEAESTQTRDVRTFTATVIADGQKVTLFTADPKVDDDILKSGVEVKRPFTISRKPGTLAMWRFARAFEAECADGSYDAALALDALPGADFHIVYNQALWTNGAGASGFWAKLTPRAMLNRWLGARVFLPPSKTRICYLFEQQSLLLRKRFGIPVKKLVALPPGLETSFQMPTDEEHAAARAAAVKKFEFPEQNWLLLVVSRELRSAAVIRTMEALAAMPWVIRGKCRLMVLTLDGSSEELQKLGEEYNLEPELFFWSGDYSARRKYYVAADLLLYPSDRLEASPPLLEAITCGLPVICTSINGFCSYVQGAGCPVIPPPFHQETLEDALAFTLPELNLLRNGVRAYAQRHNFSRRAEHIYSTIRQVQRPVDKSAMFTPELQNAILAAHRTALSKNKFIKNEKKRAVTRVKIPGSGSFIVKEFRRAPWWHLRDQSKATAKSTLLMRDFTPYCWMRHQDPETGSTCLVFCDCGEGNFFGTDYAARADAEKLYAACGEVLAQLHSGRLYHADTKPANFVINQFCHDECQNSVCLVDCDKVRQYQRPLPWRLRIHNAAQFIAGTGKVARLDRTKWRMLIDAFRAGYNRNSELPRSDLEQFWLQVWSAIRHGENIENNLPGK